MRSPLAAAGLLLLVTINMQHATPALAQARRPRADASDAPASCLGSLSYSGSAPDHASRANVTPYEAARAVNLSLRGIAPCPLLQLH